MNDGQPDAECRAMPLAHNPVGMVALCRCCGHVHLNLQYVTLRFEADAFRELAELLTQGQHQIDRLAMRPTRLAEPAVH